MIALLSHPQELQSALEKLEASPSSAALVVESFETRSDCRVTIGWLMQGRAQDQKAGLERTRQKLAACAQKTMRKLYRLKKAPDSKFLTHLQPLAAFIRQQQEGKRMVREHLKWRGNLIRGYCLRSLQKRSFTRKSVTATPSIVSEVLRRFLERLHQPARRGVLLYAASTRTIKRPVPCSTLEPGAPGQPRLLDLFSGAFRRNLSRITW